MSSKCLQVFSVKYKPAWYLSNFSIIAFLLSTWKTNEIWSIKQWRSDQILLSSKYKNFCNKASEKKQINKWILLVFQSEPKTRNVFLHSVLPGSNDLKNYLAWISRRRVIFKNLARYIFRGHKAWNNMKSLKACFIISLPF